MMAGVASQPKTPMRSVRVPDDVWIPAREKAEREGTNLSEVIRDHLNEYNGTPAVDTLRLVEGVHYKRDGERVILTSLPKGITALEF